MDKFFTDELSQSELVLKEKFLSSFYGFVVGDALGVPYEFRYRGTFQVSDMASYGTWNQPAGTWSDDTSMTLALMENLSEKGDWRTLMEKFVAFRDEGAYTPFQKAFDVGNTCAQAILRFELGFSPLEAGSIDETANGNGALMRVFPLAFSLYEETDFYRRSDIIRECTRLTHGHLRSQVASVLYCELIRNLLQGMALGEAMQETGKNFVRYYNGSTDLMSEYENHFERDLIEDKQNKAAPNSTAYVVDTFSAALWCLQNTNSYQAAILTAVNLGGDTDTTAAVTGTLAGILYGGEVIPENWRKSLQNDQLLKTISQRFCDTVLSQRI